MTFMGYLRENGSVGIRNHIAVIPTVFCANGAVENIAKAVPEVTCLSHSDGCDTKRVRTPYFTDTVLGIAKNPNVYGTILVTLGCEPDNAKKLAEQLRAEGYRAFGMVLQEDGGGAKVVEKCSEVAREWLAEIEKLERVECPLEKLTIGFDTPFEMKREDRKSACAGNQDEEEDALLLADYLAKWFRGQGANVITPTFYRFYEHMRNDKERIQPLGFCERIGERKGVFTVDHDGPRFKGPANGFFTLDPSETFLGQFCSGAQVMLFGSGKTLPLGFPVAPLMKYCSGQAYKFGDTVEDTDVVGPFTEELGQYCAQQIIEIANGKKTFAEEMNGDDDLLGFLRRSNWY